MSEEKQYPLNDSGVIHYWRMVDLKEAFGDFMKPNWLGMRPVVASVVEFSRAVSDARATFWLVVYAQYPELRGCSLTATPVSVTKMPEVTA